LNAATVFGWSPLMYLHSHQHHPRIAIKANNMSIFHLLLESGVSIDGCGPGPAGQGLSMTPLMIACWYGVVGAAEHLTQKGADINAQSKLNGFTALMYLVSAEQHDRTIERLKISDLLLKNGGM
jgi:ankyrin repeat protein